MTHDRDRFLDELCEKSRQRMGKLPKYVEPNLPEFRVSDFDSLKSSYKDNPEEAFNFVLEISKDTDYINILNDQKFCLSL